MRKQIVAVCGILVHNNKVLMQQRSEPDVKKAHLKWEFSGGKIEFGEHPEDALRREFLEENGRVIKIDYLLPYLINTVWESKTETRHVVCLLYVCSLVKEKKNIPHDSKVVKIAWVEIDKIKDLDTLPGVKEAIEVLMRL